MGRANATPAIIVVYHVCAYGRGAKAAWSTILREQVDKMHCSGLYAACRGIHCFVSGSDADTCVAWLRAQGAKFVIEACEPEDRSYERLALEGMHQKHLIPSKEELALLYLHSKGVTKKGVSADRVADWRRYMEYWLIGRWRECVRRLSNTDVVGVNCHATPRLHFSGNFWWARGDYVRRLPKRIDKNYFAPEWYVCSKSPRIFSWMESGVDHYRKAYPPIEYIDLYRTP